MSRINYSDDEDFHGQFALWQANCDRSIRGKAGQRELRELEAALVALPEKRLIHGALQNDEGGVCAIACYAKRKGLDLSKFDPEHDSDEVGIAGGMPRLVAWTVVSLNDIVIEAYYTYVQGPSRDRLDYERLGGFHGVRQRFIYTPEERYEKVLAWVREQLQPSAGRPPGSGQPT